MINDKPLTDGEAAETGSAEMSLQEGNMLWIIQENWYWIC